MSLELGGRDKEVVKLLGEIVKHDKGRLDVINTDDVTEGPVKNKYDNQYRGRATFWSSTIPQLEYDVVFIEPDSFYADEDYAAIVREYWHKVRVDGVLVGQHSEDINEVIEALGLDDLNIDLDEQDGEEIGIWWRVK